MKMAQRITRSAACSCPWEGRGQGLGGPVNFSRKSLRSRPQPSPSCLGARWPDLKAYAMPPTSILFSFSLRFCVLLCVSLPFYVFLCVPLCFCLFLSVFVCFRVFLCTFSWFSCVWCVCCVCFLCVFVCLLCVPCVFSQCFL